MKQRTKLIHEGEFAVEVPVEIIEPAPGWEPCIPLSDALKLDQTRAALRSGDLREAGKYGKVYHLTPLSA